MSDSSRETTANTVNTTNTSTSPAAANKSKFANVPCRFFQQGTCRHGAECRFSHDPAIIAAAPVEVPRARNAAPVLIAVKPGVPVFSIDVECVATGKQHNQRATAQIALVDARGDVVLDLYVKPEGHVESYLGGLTGLSKELLDEKGIALETALAQLREALPSNAILVGQNIGKDVEWLKLKEGEDFAALIDLAALMRVWNDRYHSFTYFGLAHAAKCWLGIDTEDGQPHNATTDAQNSVALFNLYCRIQHSPGELMQMQQKLLQTEVAPSFAKANPVYEGCCMGNRKLCQCGAPFFS